jgi:hypothetical protein
MVVSFPALQCKIMMSAVLRNETEQPVQAMLQIMQQASSLYVKVSIIGWVSRKGWRLALRRQGEEPATGKNIKSQYRTHLKNVDQGSGQVVDSELAVVGVGRRAVPPRRDEHVEPIRNTAMGT